VNLFITGISGLLGLNLALQYRHRFQVSGCYHNSPVHLDGVQALPLDILQSHDTEEMIRATRPDVIIHTAGLTNVEGCEADPELAFQLNADAAGRVAKIAASLDARLVHISTDHLFDGTSPSKTETDAPAPLNAYARSKWAGEQAVMEACPQALMVRTNFYGWGTSVRASFSDWILQGLEQRRELTMFSDVYYTPILINSLGEVIHKLLDRGAEGLFNVVGRERLSKYEFALNVAKVFGYPEAKIRPISVEELSFTAQRPKDMSLSSNKVEDFLKCPMPTVLEDLEDLLKWRGLNLHEDLERALQGALLDSGSGARSSD
jgi:dTDP-4-dehydrorhamnose reductase